MKKYDLFVDEKFLSTVNSKIEVKDFINQYYGNKNNCGILNVVEYGQYGIIHVWNIESGNIPGYFLFNVWNQ